MIPHSTLDSNLDFMFFPHLYAPKCVPNRFSYSFPLYVHSPTSVYQQS